MITGPHQRPAGTRQRHSSGQVAGGHVSARRCRQPRLDRLRRHGCADASLGSRGCGIIGDVDLIARLRVMNPIPPPPTSPHETRATGFLRPAVFGGSDGLVSNLALVMGVAGASSDNQAIVIAGIAGLLAGAFSMAVGEYISVRSQHELFDAQRRLQVEQLRIDEAGERAILEGIYQERGFNPEEARAIVGTLFATPERALDSMMRDEVGLDPKAIGGPWAAAISSFLAFISGAIIPLLPFLLLTGTPALIGGVAISLGALFLLGLGVSRLTGRPPLRCGLRQMGLGGIAALITFLIGQAIGSAI
jgi:VIT1/CCC1 family predicted Fe2+/Mn2+ transporter